MGGAEHTPPLLTMVASVVALLMRVVLLAVVGLVGVVVVVAVAVAVAVVAMVVGLVVVMQSPALLSSAGIFSPVSLSVSLSPMLFKSL